MQAPRQKLTPNFSLAEFLRSATAERQEEMLRQQYEPPGEVIGNLSYLCSTALQPIREQFAYPMRVTSGYRSPALNEAVGGSKTSQHCKGQAADIQISDRFLSDPRYEPLRRRIADRVLMHTGKRLRDDVNANFYLYAYICLRREVLDVDQVIHEYGDDKGRPAWIHISASVEERERSRQMLVIGRYHSGRKTLSQLKQALALGT